MYSTLQLANELPTVNHGAVTMTPVHSTPVAYGNGQVGPEAHPPQYGTLWTPGIGAQQQPVPIEYQQGNVRRSWLYRALS